MRSRTPLHTRVFGTTAAALVVGVLVWGGPAPQTKVDEVQSVPREAARPPTTMAVPLQATVARPQPRKKVQDPDPDPDNIGPCPKKHSPVIWQGLEDGRPTWKHRDGSITQRVRQRATTRKGEVVEVPTIVSMRPAAEATDSR